MTCGIFPRKELPFLGGGGNMTFMLLSRTPLTILVINNLNVHSKPTDNPGLSCP